MATAHEGLLLGRHDLMSGPNQSTCTDHQRNTASGEQRLQTTTRSRATGLAASLATCQSAAGTMSRPIVPGAEKV